jgi:hypothetical protein
MTAVLDTAAGAALFLLLRLRRQLFERQAEQFAHAGILLAREPPQRRTLVGSNSNRDLPVRIAVWAASFEVVTCDGSADNFTRRLEAVPAAARLNSFDERYRQIKREGGGRLAGYFGHT